MLRSAALALGALTLATTITTCVPPSPEERLVAELNAATRSRNARLEYVGSEAFSGSLRIERFRLGNGLAVLVVVDRSAPVVSYQTWLKVGSRNEHEGKTGLAHLFEHLMFNETEHLAKGEFDRRMETIGAETNAATWVDWTFYYENVPARELPLVVELESDRLAHLVLRDPQVTSEKDVVANERRFRVDDDVEGGVNEQLYATAFRRHPYHWPTIGWMQDIEGFTTTDCRAFYRTYYAPNNATVVIVGDVDLRSALSLIQSHYGPQRASRIPESAAAPEPQQRAERRLELTKPTPTEKLQLGYRAPAFADYDHAVLTVANEILFGGRSSRLYRALVSDGEIASDVRGSVAPFRDPGLYEVWASAREGHTAEQMLAVIDRETTRIARTRVSAAELEKAKNRLELGFLSQMDTASGKAEQIGFYETVLGDGGRVFARLDAYRRVTRDDVLRVVARVLDVRRRTVILVRAGGEAPEEEGAEAAE